MSLPPDDRSKFVVFIVEAPSDLDLFVRRTESEIIQRFVELSNMPCVSNTAISSRVLTECLLTKLPQTMAQYPGHIPVLHISAHGNSEGIQLSMDDFLEWTQLREILKVVNKRLGGHLVLCMSSCEGYSAIRMAMYPEETEFPYFVLVGCGSTPTWSETTLGYQAFYHHLLNRGENIFVAADHMRSASGNHYFWLEHAEKTREFYIEFLRPKPTQMPNDLLALQPANTLLALSELARLRGESE